MTRDIEKYGQITHVAKEVRADLAFDVDSWLIKNLVRAAERDGWQHHPGRDKVEWVDPDLDPLARSLDPGLPPNIWIARASIAVVRP